MQLRSGKVIDNTSYDAMNNTKIYTRTHTKFVDQENEENYFSVAWSQRQNIMVPIIKNLQINLKKMKINFSNISGCKPHELSAAEKKFKVRKWEKKYIKYITNIITIVINNLEVLWKYREGNAFVLESSVGPEYFLVLDVQDLFDYYYDADISYDDSKYDGDLEMEHRAKRCLDLVREFIVKYTSKYYEDEGSLIGCPTINESTMIIHI